MHLHQSWLNPCAARVRPFVAAVLLSAVSLGALLLTSPSLPMVWDEGNAIRRAEGIARWAARWRQPDGPRPLSAEAIAADWCYTTQVEGHPAFYGTLIATGRAMMVAWLAPLDSARFGPMLWFALSAGALFYRMARQWSITAGLVAVAALLLMPRMFAHAHFASFDGPLTACWVLAWAGFAPARRRLIWAATWGGLLGLTMSCKFTGWLAPLPFLVWAIAYRDRAAARALVVAIPIAVAVFFLLNPPLWHTPIDGLGHFFDLNLHRAANPGLNISTLFLGEMYNLDFPLPWYNTLVWTAVAVPVGILALAALGLVATVYQRDAQGVLVVLSWAVLVVLRALPGVPVHDGIRLFLPSFAMLSALAGVGAAAALQACRTRVATAASGCLPPNAHKNPQLAPRAVGRWVEAIPCALRTVHCLLTTTYCLLLLLLAGSASSLAWYWPQGLSYYNVLIGGLPGAVAAGMETTYYWDGLDREVLDWLRQNTSDGEKIAFGSHSPETLDLMYQWGALCRPAFVAPATSDAPLPPARWYVVQRRPSGLRAPDRYLIKHSRPVYQKRICRGGWGPWGLDQPIVEVYAYSDYTEAVHRASSADHD